MSFHKSFSTRSLLFFVGLAHLPMTIEYTLRMWRTGHYQFFPLVILVIAWLWFQMSERLSALAQPPDRRWLATLVSLDLVLVSAATLLHSSFLGAIALSALFATTVYGLYGWEAFKQSWPLMFLTLFIIPLPARLDAKLIFYLQFVASQLASWILDVFQQTHFVEGVVLQTESRGFLTEEACSGVRSLFSSLAGIAVYGVTMRYGLGRQVLNLIQTVGWVIVGNAFRIALVVVISEHVTDQIASGRPHELLGLFSFLIIFLLAVSTDHLISAFARTRDVSIVEPEDSRKPSAKVDSAWAGSTGWLGIATIPICLVIFLVGARLTYAQTLNSQGLGFYTNERLPFPESSDLPDQMGEWRKVDFRHTNRGKENLQAEDSFIWTFDNGLMKALVSVDCPWDVWHNLDNCYTGLGWDTDIKHFFPGGDPLPADFEFEDQFFSQILMTKNSGESGVVIFASLDANAELVAPKFSVGIISLPTVSQQVAGNIGLALGFSNQQTASLKGYRLPLTTIQLYCTPETETTPAQLHSLRQLFVEARDVLKRSRRFQKLD